MRRRRAHGKMRSRTMGKDNKMGSWSREKIHISKNGRYLMEGETPFFWLGDTAWLMLQKLKEEDVRIYLRNRKEKGYNVIQTVLAHTLPERDTNDSPVQTTNRRGIESADSGTRGLRDVTKPEYWDFVDRVVKIAEELELYLGLLPAWGSLVKKKVLNMENVKEYADFLGKRYQSAPNIIWILGGDIRGDAGGEVFRREGETLKGYNPDRLITFHPFGRTSSSLWFHEEPWLDFNMFQSGHRRYDQAALGEWDDNKAQETFFGEDSWRYVNRDHGYATEKPTLDGEPSYEGIPQGLHNPRNPFWEEWDVRRYAYWSVFAGAAGHTYGSNAIMQFYDDPSERGSYGVREVWKDAMHHPGSSQMKHLKELMESVDFVRGMPEDSLLRFGQKERYHRVSVFAGEDFVLCYDYSGDEFMLDLTRYMEKEMDAWWMNPQDGVYSYIDTLQGQEKRLFCPAARKDRANDWVLVLKERRQERSSCKEAETDRR